MARYTQPVCRVCRREGGKLFLKGTRCSTDKCAFDRRGYVPGQHGKTSRTKLSNYGLQLREKQKVKKIYGVLEKQFRRYFSIATRSKGVTGEKLLEILERRVDNVIFRACFASSRQEARQLVNHGHIKVNTKNVNIASYSIKTGDVVEIKPEEKVVKGIKENLDKLKDRALPAWLETDQGNLKIKIIKLPQRTDVGLDIQEQLIVELYSK